MVRNQRCYKKNLEGLAKYISNLNFEAVLDLYFQKDIMNRVNKSGDRYTQKIVSYLINFKPKFSSFYSRNECLIHIFIPQTSVRLRSKYVDNTTTCCFNINVLKETVLKIKISKKDLKGYSLDFKEVKEIVLDKISKYCEAQLRNLRDGLWDTEKTWFIDCDFTSCNLVAYYS